MLALYAEASKGPAGSGAYGMKDKNGVTGRIDSLS
jgi:hypothetical protein